MSWDYSIRSLTLFMISKEGSDLVKSDHDRSIFIITDSCSTVLIRVPVIIASCRFAAPDSQSLTSTPHRFSRQRGTSMISWVASLFLLLVLRLSTATFAPQLLSFLPQRHVFPISMSARINRLVFTARQASWREANKIGCYKSFGSVNFQPPTSDEDSSSEQTKNRDI